MKVDGQGGFIPRDESKVDSSSKSGDSVIGDPSKGIVKAMVKSLNGNPSNPIKREGMSKERIGKILSGSLVLGQVLSKLPLDPEAAAELASSALSGFKGINENG